MSEVMALYKCNGEKVMKKLNPTLFFEEHLFKVRSKAFNLTRHIVKLSQPTTDFTI